MARFKRCRRGVGASALYGRGLAKLKKGDKVGSDADFSAAKTIEAKIGDDFKRFGVQ